MAGKGTLAVAGLVLVGLGVAIGSGALPVASLLDDLTGSAATPTPDADRREVGDTTVPATTAAPPDAQTIDTAALRRALHERANALRSQPVRRRGDLHRLSATHASAMLQADAFGRYKPNETSPRERYIQHGIGGCQPRQNLYKTADVAAAANEAAFARRVIQHWYEDADAASNMLQADLTAEGFGVAIGELKGERTIIVVAAYCDK